MHSQRLAAQVTLWSGTCEGRGRLPRLRMEAVLEPKQECKALVQVLQLAEDAG
jgi:hypothetical protein